MRARWNRAAEEARKRMEADLGRSPKFGGQVEEKLIIEAFHEVERFC